jgi:hypothetical protein
MKRLIATVTLGMVLLTAPAVTLAADYCAGPWSFFTQYSFMLVGKRFRTPAKGQCKPFTGFLQSIGEFDTANYPVTGSGCTDFNGSLKIIGMYTAGGSQPATITLNINTSTGAGSGTDCRMDVGNGGGCATMSQFDVGTCRADFPG